MKYILHFTLFTLFLLICMAGCNSEEESLMRIAEENNLEKVTRSNIEDFEDWGDLVEYEPDENLEIIKHACHSRMSSNKMDILSSYDTYDETLRDNMYAIRDLPASIKVRKIASSGSTEGFVALSCNGSGKEVILDQGNDAVNNRFYVKVPPAITGVPYMIYSAASNTPLTVGYYTNNPDTKILMAAHDNSGTSFLNGWDFLRSNVSKNYYSLQSESYIGREDPNNEWSIFYYVLEAVGQNKIRYSKRQTDKAQQEFTIIPDAPFELASIEYSTDSQYISRSEFKMTKSVENTSLNEAKFNIPFDIDQIEVSNFDKSNWSVNLNFSNPSKMFLRPSVINGKIITVTDKSEGDASFLYNGTQSINRKISYSHPIKCDAYSTAKVTVTFVRYYVKVNYTVKARFNYKQNQNGATVEDVRECLLKGTWSGTIIEDPNKVQPSSTVVCTPIGGGDIILQ